MVPATTAIATAASLADCGGKRTEAFGNLADAGCHLAERKDGRAYGRGEDRMLDQCFPFRFIHCQELFNESLDAGDHFLNRGV